MSFALMAWANRQTTGSGTRKAVLLALADRANADTGKCCPSVELIAEQTEFSIRTVQTALADLCESGLISRERRKRSDGWLGGYDYIFHVEPGAGAAHRPAGAADARPAGAADEGEPRTDLEPGSALAHAGAASRLVAIGKVDRLPVSDEHNVLAQDVLALWNQLTGQSLGSKDWLKMIVMRLREHPDYGLPEYEHVIRAALANPWWSGPPSPNVVFGNGAQFERSVVAAQSGGQGGVTPRRYGLGMTTEEILRSTRDDDELPPAVGQ